MLQNLRENMKGWAGGIIVGFLVIVLSAFGVDALFSTPAQTRSVASVNGDEIAELDVLRAIQARKNQLRAQFGANFPEDMFTDEMLREPVLEELIKAKAMEQVAVESGYAVSTRRIDKMILEESAFQEDGKYNQDRFRLLANQLGYTPLQFRERLAGDFIANQQAAALVASGFVTDAEVAAAIKLSQQKRDFYYLTIPFAPIEAATTVSGEAIESYYETNKSSYMNPEQVSIQYLEIQLADIEARTFVDEEDLRSVYEEERAVFVANTERQAAHILIEPKDDGADANIIETVQQRLAAGEDFAAVAAELSDDLGSREQGGDLGYTDGNTFPAEFETALAALRPGQVSDPVKTDSGTHIIKLLDLREVVPPTFEEDRARIAAALKRSRAEKEFLELAQQLEDATYNVKDLAPAGEIMGVPVKVAGPFARSGGFGIASNPKVTDAAFSDDVLVARNTSAAIDIAPNHKLVLRVTDHQTSRVLALDEVRAEVEIELRRQMATEQLNALGAQLQAEVAAGKSVEDLAREKGYEWQVSQNTLRSDPKVSRELVAHVFKLRRPTDAPVVGGVSLNSGDYAVVSVTKVVDGDYANLSQAEKDNLRDRLAQLWGEASYMAYESSQVAAADVDR